MDDKKNENSAEINQEIVNLVVARLKTIPGNAKLSIGNDKEPLSAEGMIEEVKKQSDIGMKIIESQLYFLRSLQNLPVA